MPGASSLPLSPPCCAHTHANKHTAYGTLLPIYEILSHFLRECKRILLQWNKNILKRGGGGKFLSFWRHPEWDDTTETPVISQRIWIRTRFLLGRQADHLQTSSKKKKKKAKAQPTASRRADRMPGLSCDIMQSILTATNTTRHLTLTLSLSHTHTHTHTHIGTHGEIKTDPRLRSALNYDSIKSHWVKVVYSRNIHNWHRRSLLVRSRKQNDHLVTVVIKCVLFSFFVFFFLRISQACTSLTNPPSLPRRS